jgi:hypothetical protein
MSKDQAGVVEEPRKSFLSRAAHWLREILFALLGI